MTLAAETPVAHDPLKDFQWTPQPQAEALILELVHDALSSLPWLKSFADRLKTEAGVRLHDCVGHIALPSNSPHKTRAEAAGWKLDFSEGPLDIYTQPQGVFPSLVFTPPTSHPEIAIKVDSVADFAAAHQLQLSIQGDPLADVRTATVERSATWQFAVIERHGSRSFTPPHQTPHDPARAIARLKHLEAFRTRKRDFAGGGGEADGYAHAMKLIDSAISDLGQGGACDLFFYAEREFWQRRNTAARVQYERQARLGIGWANHDHHTYRCSRANFTRLIAVWEKLGFKLRERYHAGAQAGWGAQILEHSDTNIITFNDVDLAPDELFQDFAHEPIPSRPQLGTVGLWCALHGDSFLQAGMHHLECMFDFDNLKTQLESAAQIKTMKPFTDFPHLRQAFTEGERWKVPEPRLQNLLTAGQITPDQATTFRTTGALGSHLENLERNAGFKGFNQKGVSEIIAATDARKHTVAS
jgi:hypothetical protein